MFSQKRPFLRDDFGGAFFLIYANLYCKCFQRGAAFLHSNEGEKVPVAAERYDGAAFDRIASVVAGLAVLGLAGFLLVRNEPIASSQLFFALRVILSFGIATLGATIPGFLNVKWSGAGLVIRAGGALALFVLTFVFTPDVLANGSTEHPVVSAPNGVAIGRDNNNSPINVNPPR